MGYFLLRESMLDSVLVARDRWLRPGGVLFPSHATMYWAAVQCEAERAPKIDEYRGAIADWHEVRERKREHKRKRERERASAGDREATR